jgi:oligopeptide/dipeptide ABC transporter ATP-binding protein
MNSINQKEPILKIENLITRFDTPEGVVYAVNGVSFELGEGETLGVVGESGSGKSVTMLSVMQLIPQPPGKIVSGKALFRDRDLLRMSGEEIRKVRGGQIGMIFQDPMTSLNPVLNIGRQISESLMLHMGLGKKKAEERAVELLRLVGIPSAEDRLDQYPHQFSGGMRQRVMIAMALACNPRILIADEPTTALDVTIQAQIVELVKKLRDEIGMSVIWITHDLGIVAGIAHRVIVMYAGFIIEVASVKDLYTHPAHPYTLGLLNSLPRLDSDERKRLTDIQGLPPLLLEQPVACPFRPRCTYAFERCKENPALFDVGEGHSAACWWNIAEGRPRNV